MPSGGQEEGQSNKPEISRCDDKSELKLKSDVRTLFQQIAPLIRLNLSLPRNLSLRFLVRLDLSTLSDFSL